MKTKGKKKFQNRLWLARRRRGLEQKQVATLMGHKTLDQVSRYETGSRLPALRAALKLEIILGVPLRFIYSELHEKLRREITARASDNAILKSALTELFGDGRCEYAELLNGKPSEGERQSAKRHATKLVNRISELTDPI